MITVTDRIDLGNYEYINLDARYTDPNGNPFSSVSAAQTYHAGKMNELFIGLTVLVKESGWTEAKEYWVQPKGTTPETYGLVEKGAGTTDYADLDNKPTISDGGQGSAQIPLSGNVKVTAKAATSGQTTGVTVTAENGGITMAFTLEKGTDGVNGKSAYQQWLDEGNTGDETDFLNSLKAHVSRFIPIATVADATSLEVGDTYAFSNVTNPTDGAMLLMPNGDTTTPKTLMFSVTSNGDTPETFTYTYVGELSISTEGFLNSDQIVNDLTTGGARNVLSAEAGKTLNLDVNGGTDATVIGSNSSAPSWSSKKCDTNGNLVTATATKLCTPVRLLAGEKLKVVQQYIPSYASIILTDETLTTNLGIAATAGYNKSYTAQQDCYVAAQINTDGTYSITKSVQYTGVKQQIGDLSDLETTNKSSLVEAINEVKSQTPTISVDDEPTKGSTNPISSNGIYEIFNGEEVSVDATYTSGYSINSSGDLVAQAGTRYSSEIPLNKGEEITMKCQYVFAGTGSTNGSAISTVNPEGSTHAYRRRVAGSAYTRESSLYVYKWVATVDCQVVLSANASGTIVVIKKTTGVDYAIATLQATTVATDGNVTELQENVAELSATDRPLALGTDYTKETTGYAINPATGVVQEQANAWISSVIAVKYGDVLEITPDYSMGNYTSVAKTDAEKTYYRPLLTNSTASKHVVPIYFDGYIVVACPNNSITLTLVLKSLSADNYKIVSDNVRAQKNNAISALSTRADERDGTLNTRYTQEFKAAEKQALFEREVMLAEVHAMTDDDVLVGGDCGYVINNDDPTDVTHGTIHWKIYKNGILYIYGYGRMYDYLKGTQACKTIASVNSFMQSYLVDEPYGWYYGFLSPNLNGITPVEAPRGYKYRYTDTDVMVYQNKRYAPNGDTINAEIKALVPTYNKVYGYAAPWYIYRTDPDLDPTNSNADYQNLADYNGHNPTSIRYNRVCIEEDLAHGGITYIGDWAFYRCTAPTLVLPDHVTAIGCWGIRYSPTIRTVVMGDMVTEMEDNSLTRMEAMEYVKLSSALQTLKYETMSMNSSLRYLSLPSGITSLPEYFGYADFMLDYLIVRGSGMLSIAKSAFTNCPLSVLDIKSGVGATSIGNSAFFGCKFLTVRIPQSVTSIVTDAFADTNVKVVVIDSSSIAGLNASAFSTAAGRLFANAEVLYIKNTIETIGATIKRYFEYFKDEGDYKVYTRLVV